MCLFVRTQLGYETKYCLGSNYSEPIPELHKVYNWMHIQTAQTINCANSVGKSMQACPRIWMIYIYILWKHLLAKVFKVQIISVNYTTILGSTLILNWLIISWSVWATASKPSRTSSFINDCSNGLKHDVSESEHNQPVRKGHWFKDKYAHKNSNESVRFHSILTGDSH